jgi:hypothetical protein
MRNGNGECVGGIGPGDFHSGEKARDHRVDLCLVGAPYADNRFLDQSRRIFADGETCPGRAHQDHAAGLPQLQGRLGILIDEHFLHGRLFRRMISNHGFELVCKCRKPARKRSGGISLDLPVRDMREPIALGFDQAPAGRSESGVEAEYLQAILSSSSSGTS